MTALESRGDSAVRNSSWLERVGEGADGQGRLQTQLDLPTSPEEVALTRSNPLRPTVALAALALFLAVLGTPQSAPADPGFQGSRSTARAAVAHQPSRHVAARGGATRSLGDALAAQAPALDRRVLDLALEAAAHARHDGVAERPDVLTVIDYSLPSTSKRLWVFDLAQRQLMFHELVGARQGERRQLRPALLEPGREQGDQPRPLRHRPHLLRQERLLAAAEGARGGGQRRRLRARRRRSRRPVRQSGVHSRARPPRS